MGRPCRKWILVVALTAWNFVFFGCDATKFVATERFDFDPSKPKPRLHLDFGPSISLQTESKVSANFVDVAADVGLRFTYHNDAAAGNLYLPEALGGGAAAFDYDLDGWCDLYFANGRSLPALQLQLEHRDRLFRNVGGRYGESTDQAHLYEFDYSHGVAVGDLNIDGFEDIMVANLGRPRVFLNQGDGSFQELLLDSLQIPSSFWVAPLLVDLDDDGLEDLLLVSYVDWNYASEREMFDHGLGYPSPGQFDGGPYLALHNQGDLTFQDRTTSWGFTATAKCLGIAAADFDHDLKPEIYVSNDGTANACYTKGRGLEINTRVTNASRLSGSSEYSTADPIDLWRDMAERSGIAGSEDGLNLTWK